jgi:hypothetical protein
MKRLIAYAGVGATVLAACGALLFITVDGESTTTVPAATPLEVLVSDLGFGDFLDLNITEADELQNQGVQPGDISVVELRAFTLEATDPPGSDLSFLEQLDVYVEAPGLDRVLIASQSDFPVGQALVDITPEDVDLTDYVVSESMTLTTDVTGSRPEDATEVVATYALRVGVTSQGACNYIAGDDGEE